MGRYEQIGFDPEGKTQILEKSRLTYTGHFPKLGKRKAMRLRVYEHWIDDSDPERHYAPLMNVGQINLYDNTKEYVDINDRREGARSWFCSIELNDYVDSHFKDIRIFVRALIYKDGWKLYHPKEIEVFILRKDATKTEEIFSYKMPHGEYFDYGDAFKTQKEVIQYILKESIVCLRQYEPQPKTVEEPVVETKRSKIPFIGGIAAIIGSAFFLKSRLK